MASSTSTKRWTVLHGGGNIAISKADVFECRRFSTKTQMAKNSVSFVVFSQNRRLQDGVEFLSTQTFATDKVWRQSGRLSILMCLNVVVSL
jgi:hypothetical protein